MHSLSSFSELWACSRYLQYLIFKKYLQVQVMMQQVYNAVAQFLVSYIWVTSLTNIIVRSSIFPDFCFSATAGHCLISKPFPKSLISMDVSKTNHSLRISTDADKLCLALSVYYFLIILLNDSRALFVLAIPDSLQIFSNMWHCLIPTGYSNTLQIQVFPSSTSYLPFVRIFTWWCEHNQSYLAICMQALPVPPCPITMLLCLHETLCRSTLVRELKASQSPLKLSAHKLLEISFSLL